MKGGHILSQGLFSSSLLGTVFLVWHCRGDRTRPMSASVSSSQHLSPGHTAHQSGQPLRPHSSGHQRPQHQAWGQSGPPVGQNGPSNGRVYRNPSGPSIATSKARRPMSARASGELGYDSPYLRPHSATVAAAALSARLSTGAGAMAAGRGYGRSLSLQPTSSVVAAAAAAAAAGGSQQHQHQRPVSAAPSGITGPYATVARNQQQRPVSAAPAASPA